MTSIADARRLAALPFAGALAFAAPVLLLPLLAPSFGSGPALLPSLLALHLLGCAVGARWTALPGWIAATIVGLALISPWPSLALHAHAPWIGFALVLLCALAAGRWTVALLSATPSSTRPAAYALETAGGILAVGSLVTWAFARHDLLFLHQALGIATLAGAALSATRRGDPTDSVAAPAVLPTRAMLALSAWSGFQFFHAEVAWTHRLAQVHTNSATAFGIVSLAVLVGMPLGALLSRRLRTLPVLAVAALGASLSLPFLQASLADGLAIPTARTDFPWVLLLHTLLAIVPAAAGASLLYPWLLERTSGAKAIAILAAANLLGGLGGALAAGWVSLPAFGLQTSLWIPSVGWALVAILTAPASRRALWAVVGIALGIATAVAWNETLVPRSDYRVVDRIETWSGRVETVERGEHTFLLYNGSYALGGSRSVASQTWQAEFAMALRPNAQEVFVLGLGTGITAGALARSPAIKRARVVELLPAVETMARRHFSPWAGPLFSDPRFAIETGDARTALREDLSRYDLILGDLFLPWLPGAELLMGREHFESVRDHLAPGGLFVQWLPLYQIPEASFLDILATASAVFPSVHLFREGHDPRSPMIALVAAAPGGPLRGEGSDPAILEFWSGNAESLQDLPRRESSGLDNRLRLGLTSGGHFPGMPPKEEALDGFRYARWIGERLLNGPPHLDPDILAFGPESWRPVVRGWFLQQAFAQRLGGNEPLADSLSAQASRVDSLPSLEKAPSATP